MTLVSFAQLIASYEICTKTCSKLHVTIHGYIVKVQYVGIYMINVSIYILMMRIYYINLLSEN